MIEGMIERFKAANRAPRIADVKQTIDDIAKNLEAVAKLSTRHAPYLRDVITEQTKRDHQGCDRLRAAVDLQLDNSILRDVAQVFRSAAKGLQDRGGPSTTIFHLKNVDAADQLYGDCLYLFHATYISDTSGDFPDMLPSKAIKLRGKQLQKFQDIFVKIWSLAAGPDQEAPVRAMKRAWSTMTNPNASAQTVQSIAASIDSTSDFEILRNPFKK